MASLSNVSLAISSGNATVTGTMTFDANEVGKSFRLEIKLFGEDKAGDNLPSDDPVGDDELITFRWGSNVFNKKPYKQFTVANAGSQSFSESRPFSDEKFDEDKGNTKEPVPWPRSDEIYANVTLSGSPVSLRSPLVVTPGK